MKLNLLVRNESSRRGLYRTDNLLRIARRACEGENLAQDAELSVLFCDDAFIKNLNKQYRGKNKPTDVLSFGQLAQVGGQSQQELVLGDIVISLETVEQRYPGDAPAMRPALRGAMRDEVRLLFCHGLLHLLGYTHNTPAECDILRAKQARYLNINAGAAWAPRARRR